MDERLRFVARLLEGEKMAPLCAELGISRLSQFAVVVGADQEGIAAPLGRQQVALFSGGLDSLIDGLAAREYVAHRTARFPPDGRTEACPSSPTRRHR